MGKIFITGATGFIGQALSLKMLKDGYRVKAVIRRQDCPSSLPAEAESVHIESIEAFDRYQDLEDVDTVIHLVGRAHLIKGRVTDSLEVFRKVNLLGTEQIARMAVKAGVKRFIFVSSVKVNGEGSSQPYSENDLPAPQDAYGISKMEAEQALFQIALKTSLQVVVLRLPLVYGQGVKANFKNLIKIVDSKLPLPFNGLSNRRSFLYLGNLVDAIITSVRHPQAGGQTFMVSDGQDISTADLIRMIASALNKKRSLFYLHPTILKALCKIAGKGEEVEKLTGTLLVDSSKIRNLLGWKPPFTLEEGIKETVKYYKSWQSVSLI
jgi:nucleoside-diphosphate-sugar epimerase